MRGCLFVVLGVVALATWADPASAVQGTLDQAQPLSAGAGNIACTGYWSAQTFTAGATGAIDHVEIALSRIGDPAPLLLEIRTVLPDGRPSTMVLASQQVPLPPTKRTGNPPWPSEWVSIAFGASPPQVTVGTAYALVVSAPGYCAVSDDPAPDSYHWLWAAYNTGYGGGMSWGSQSPDFTDRANSHPAYDVAFKTFVSPLNADQTIAFPAIADHSAVQSPFNVAPTATSGLPVTVTSKTPGVCTASGAEGKTITLVGLGICTLQANQAGELPYYNAARSKVRSFQVANKTSQTITFPTPSSRPVTSSPFVPKATASSGLPVTLVSVTPPVCTTDGSAVTLHGVGTCTLEANQGGDDAYSPAPPVRRSFGVTKANQTIAFKGLGDRPITRATFAVSAVASSGLPVMFSAATPSVCAVDGNAVSLKSTGTCTITAAQPGDGTFNAAPSVSRSFSVTKAVQAITFRALPDRTISQSPFVVQATSSSGLPVSFTTATPSVCVSGGTRGSTITLLAPGACTVQADQAGDTTYGPAAPKSRSFTVS